MWGHPRRIPPAPNFFDTKKDAQDALTSDDATVKAKLVQIYVERLEAKVRVGFDWKSNTVKNNVSFGDKTGLTAVALKKTDGTNLMITKDNQEVQVYALFHGWEVTNTINRSYLFKNINAAWTDTNLGFTPWNTIDYKRSFWAMNPGKDSNNALYSYKKYSEVTRDFYSRPTSVDAENANAVAYCFENAADVFETGAKSSYNPTSQLSNRTQVIMAATLVTIDESDKATALDLIKWMGTDYASMDAVKAAMFAPMAQQFWVKDTENSTDDKIAYKTITLNELTLVYGNDIDDLRDAEADKRYLNYLQLTEEAKKNTYYTRAKKADSEEYEYTEYTGAEVNTWLLGNVLGAQNWKNGATYYYTDIKHLGSTGKYAEYGVVRNHIYDLKLQKVTGFGTPVIPGGTDEKPIIPQHPQEDETYLAAQINVLAWRVVNNNVDLQW